MVGEACTRANIRTLLLKHYSRLPGIKLKQFVIPRNLLLIMSWKNSRLMCHCGISDNPDSLSPLVGYNYKRFVLIHNYCFCPRCPDVNY